jgi:leader peptidase (prepilin peptidase)/N-methyltransferase
MTVSAPERSGTPALRACWTKLRSTRLRRISITWVRPPWTKVVVGLVAVAAMAVSLISAPGLSGVLGAGLALIMFAVAVIDARRFIIPNPLTAAAFALALVHAAVQQSPALLPALSLAIGLAIGRGVALALFFLLLRHLYKTIRGREGIGLGDVKLAGVAGAWLDWWMMPIAIELAAVAALLVYFLRQSAFHRAVAATHRVPFGLFFAPAIWLCWVMETTWLIG